MITYDRSIGTMSFRAESGKFVSFLVPRVGFAGPTRGAPARQKNPPAGSCKFDKGESAWQIRGFDPRVSQAQTNSRVMMD